ncbi:MAG: prepilin-type N-terminal cleavage/methylation domain-containing protein [Alphaproteobacteria bacterium]|nr:prepilin-type N-terminal cleavage/methylation domain-containing protein [Alphaproteobacteria bacterium]
MRSAKAGFTLVEVAIVVVIIGLIIGGVLVGRDLIKSSELRSVISDFNEYKAAVYTFRSRYNGFPGDLRNATQHWEAADAAECDPDNVTPDLSEGTCDGNGTKIMGAIVCGSATTEPCFETYTFWQHLSLAGLVKGTFGADTSAFAAIDDYALAVPQSDVNSRWFWVPVYSGGAGYLAAAFPATNNKNLFSLGLAIVDGATGNATSHDANYFDEKIDDGNPGRGKLTVFPGTACTENPDGTPTTNASLNPQYKLGDENATPCFIFIAY